MNQYVFVIGTLNVQGSLQDNSLQINEFLNEREVDLLMVQDTGMVRNTYEFSANGYEVICQASQSTNPASGLVCIVKKAIGSTCVVETSAHPRIQQILIKFPFEARILNTYKKPKDSALNLVLKNMEYCPLNMIVGDLNSYTRAALDVISSSVRPSAFKQPAKSLQDNGWTDAFRYLHPEKQMYSRWGSVMTPEGKRNTASRIDHIFVGKEWKRILKSCDIIEDSIIASDHLAVVATFSASGKAPAKQPKLITYRPGLKNKAKWAEYREIMTPPVFDATRTIDENLQEGKAKHMEAYDEIFPEKTTQKELLDRAVFVTREYSAFKFKKKIALRLVRECRDHITQPVTEVAKILFQKIKYDNEETPDTANLMLGRAQDALYRHKREIRSLLNRSRKKKLGVNVKNLCDRVKANPHNMYKLLKQGEEYNINCIIEPQRIVVKKEEIHRTLVNKWGQVFKKKVGLSLDFQDKFLKYMPKPPPQTDKPKPDFSVRHLRYIVEGKGKTSPGASQISWGMLAHASNETLRFWSEFFTHCYTNELDPISWKQGITTLLPKPNTPPTPLGFRPITLLSVEYKLYTHVLNKALLDWVLQYEIIPPSQNGALPNRGTDTCLWTYLSVIRNANVRKSAFHAIYVDFNKAYDSVEHWTIEQILLHLGVGKLGKVIMIMLANSYTNLKVNQEVVEGKIPFECGVKQGDIISPLLFLLFISPLLWKVHKKLKGYKLNGQSHLLAAIMDDIVFFTSKRAEVKQFMSILNDFSQCTGIEVNSKKSQYAHIHDAPAHPKFKNELLVVLGSEGHYKYLGVWISLDLNWDIQLETSFGNMCGTLRIIGKKFYLNPILLVEMINKVVFAQVAYRMQIMIFPKEWIKKVEDYIQKMLRKTTRINMSYQLWREMFGLISLQEMNAQRYVASLQRQLAGSTAMSEQVIEGLMRWDETEHEIAKWEHPSQVLEREQLQYVSFNARVPEYYEAVIEPPLEAVSRVDQVKIFTDGSLKETEEGKGMHAAWIAVVNGVETQRDFHCNGPINSTEPELQAIWDALETWHKARVIDIYTDSLNAISKCLKAKYGKQRFVNSPNHLTIRRIAHSKAMGQWTEGKEVDAPEEGDWVRFFHVFSHGDINLKQKQRNVDRYKENSEDIMHYNCKVDDLVQEKNEQVSFPHPATHPYSPKAIVYAEHTSTTQLIADNYLRQNREEWRSKEPTKSSRILNHIVDMDRTMLEIKHSEPGQASKVRNLVRTLTLTMPVRKYINRLQTAGIPLFNERYWLKYFSSPLCVACEERGEQRVEDTMHVAWTCNYYQHNMNTIVEQLITLLQEKGVETDTFPWWFTNSTPYRASRYSWATNLDRFDRDLGNRGYIPAALVPYLRNFQKGTEAKDTANKITHLIHSHILNRWSERCKLLFRGNRGHPMQNMTFTM